MTDTPMPSASPAPVPTVEDIDRAMQSALRLHPWSFTVIHGDLEEPEDVAGFNQLCELARAPGCLLMSQGHNDQTTWLFGQDGGRAACMAMSAIALTVGRFWWRCQTRFGGSDR